jgi:hypothetical protein
MAREGGWNKFGTQLEPDVLNQVVATERIVALRKRLRALPEETRNFFACGMSRTSVFPKWLKC